MDPNDGHCHMDTAGYYTESLNQVGCQVMFLPVLST